MREIIILSGKGGTGKTSFTAAFAHIIRESGAPSGKAVIADLDVDAPDLHLILHPQKNKLTPFFSGHTAEIQKEKCSQCGTCMSLCKFNAVTIKEDVYETDPIRCEGCGVCVHFCPEKAIAFPENQCGEWGISETRFGKLVHARLFPGEENSGKLVALLRKESGKAAKETGANLILSDGPPGIGCPVISALSGVDLAVAVTEPTPSGIHDLKRVAELCRHFNIPVVVIINKCDLNIGIAKQIHDQSFEYGFRVIAEIPYDSTFISALVHGKTLTEYSSGATAVALKKAWLEILAFENERITSVA